MVIVVGLLAAFVLVLVFSNRRTRNCRWREDRAADVGRARCYRCMACGAEAFTTNGKPPLDCQRNSVDL
ncbi:hypothetical protein G5B38_13655 [Pseudohalocynthiibacter aestuariivivens]|uniref:Uncharacterized protein n=1 Tax=Roseovarius pelagicus TaxID=2980108 RepID=A0ABY6DFT2_9RHOB|nr:MULTISPECIES: hypothetical protein [Rhodobacterales]QIE46482.1 hypothetical protein G5B38_13655 [Pseudohalocynthiibacter aestuariivivens]UXX84996.1 hypothetical protein N7U68_10285 [Roseovarius pelagicus]